MRASFVMPSTALLLLAGPCLAITCDPDLYPGPRPTGYAERGNRCEGIFVSHVFGEPIELVSLVRGPGLGTVKSQQVSVTPIPASSGTSNVRVVPIPLDLYYRLDAPIAPGGMLIWPLGDVVRPRGIDLSRLGVYAFVQPPGENRIYSAVSVGAVATPTSPAVTTALLRPGYNLRDLRWRFLRRDGDVDPTWTDVGLVGDLLSVSLPAAKEGILEVSWSEGSGQPRYSAHFDLRT